MANLDFPGKPNGNVAPSILWDNPLTPVGNPQVHPDLYLSMMFSRGDKEETSLVYYCTPSQRFLATKTETTTNYEKKPQSMETFILRAFSGTNNYDLLNRL
ncbi:hypothetical protein RUM44_010535 [Polyplax serrata]|uniref:Uncharacterized protein n=1 Tax=Polyplax serrata TaxID=468196 RepID=A0ABR1AW46_POLSC